MHAWHTSDWSMVMESKMYLILHSTHYYIVEPGLNAYILVVITFSLYIFCHEFLINKMCNNNIFNVSQAQTAVCSGSLHGHNVQYGCFPHRSILSGLHKDPGGTGTHLDSHSPLVVMRPLPSGPQGSMDTICGPSEDGLVEFRLSPALECTDRECGGEGCSQPHNNSCSIQHTAVLRPGLGGHRGLVGIAHVWMGVCAYLIWVWGMSASVVGPGTWKAYSNIQCDETECVGQIN